MLTPRNLLTQLRLYLDGLAALGKFDAHVQAETHRANRHEIEAHRLRGLLEILSERIRKLEADLEHLTRWRKQAEEPCALHELVLYRNENYGPDVINPIELDDGDEWRPLELAEKEQSNG